VASATCLPYGGNKVAFKDFVCGNCLGELIIEGYSIIVCTECGAVNCYTQRKEGQDKE